MSTPKYTFREGSRISGVTPDVVAVELERIRKSYGTLTASAVVDEARPETAPLHRAFSTWDVEEAAEQFWLQEARTIIRSVQIIYPDEEPRTIYVHVQDATRGEGGYEPLALVVRQPDRLALALSELKAKSAAASQSVQEVLSAIPPTDPRKPKVTRAAVRVRKADEAVQAIV